VKASGFLFGALVLGVYLSPRLFAFASRLDAGGVLLAVGLAMCFTLAWLADAIGLAPIVGAFAAGLVLEDLHYRHFTDRGEHTLIALIEPIASFLVPILFRPLWAFAPTCGSLPVQGVRACGGAHSCRRAGKQLCALASSAAGSTGCPSGSG